LERIEPGWIDVFHADTKKLDFEIVVRQVDNGFCAGLINEWLDAFEKGEEPKSLYEGLRE
jgi:hypothetical protein